MISYDFEYCKPSSAEEAVRLFQQADSSGLNPLYYSGGTEFISMARLDRLRTGAVIDIKGIADCRLLEARQDQLVIGAAIPLTTISEWGMFPLLGESARHVADYTNRNKITVGGNLCGKFIYREALLPFLLADSRAVLAGPEGRRTIPVMQVFNGEPRLAKGELLLQLLTDRSTVRLPFFTVRKTKLEVIDYPIVRVAALRAPEGIRAAFSGVSSIPFRSIRVEEALNDTSVSMEHRIENAIRLWPAPILRDILASAEYRTFVLRNALSETLTALGG
ncbi:FAD binding domain-containing protein [Paenibacillus filicis]|uniref:FAD binding domain-containing protein n=1 Tax=Paenibacillus gyeongsangnamensis TaxID=3388067 RepID=A0ABT4QAB9_9BACL|nr:FAD binding domain-containing protein [Paenibacillus filicis]MCZ8513764.1 FAD binding domain-containing protein [Paenibacillus filicis]